MTAPIATRWRSRGGEPDPRDNALNFLRLALALLVVVSHSWPLAGFGPTPRWGSFDVGDWAVSGFFALSGWLITSSRLSSRPVDFLWRRCLRIYPAFAACLLVVAFGFAPLSALLRGSAYSVSDGVPYVLRNAALVMEQWNVGTTLRGAPKPDQWNGPLWSLAFEFACYLLIGALVTVVARRWLVAAVVVSFAGLVLAQLVVRVTSPAVPPSLELLLRLAPYFFAGAVLYVLRHRVPWRPWAGVVSALVLVLSMATRTEITVGSLALAHLLLWLGAVLPFTRIGRRNDLSYGFYIYAWPVQQVLFLLGASALGVPGFAALSVALTLPLAAASWFGVERPAMRLRHWGRTLDEVLTRAARGPRRGGDDGGTRPSDGTSGAAPGSASSASPDASTLSLSEHRSPHLISADA